MADGKNKDIGEILDSIWGDGKLNIGRRSGKHTQAKPSVTPPAELSHAENMAETMKASIENAESARETIVGVNSLTGKAQASIQSSLDELTKQVQQEMEGLDARMKADGLYTNEGLDKTGESAPVEEEKPAVDLEKAIEAAEKNVKESVIGQEMFISEVAKTFKRAFMSKSSSGARAVIMGAAGTGKHLTLESFANALHREGAFRSNAVNYIDMAKYGDSAADKLFVQDVFAALKAESKVIAFENFERAHTTVNAMLGQLFVTAKISLSSRYTEQKGMLVEIGTALVPNAISELDATEKFLYIITEQNEKKLMDTFGMPFINSIDGICKTEKPDEAAVLEIAKRLLSNFAEEAKSRFDYTLKPKENTAEALAKSYVPDDGAKSMQIKLTALMKALGEHKLKSPESANGELAADGDSLVIKLGEAVIEAQETGREKESAVAEVKAELDEVVGLDFIKKYILSLEDNLKVQQMRKKKGMKADFPAMHMIFTGNPGTGKTTIARIISRYLKAVGLLSGGQLVEVTRADLVGRYVGHTAPLTQKAIESALGGVLFIDEAYSLYRGTDDSFGLEAIDTLVKGMEDNRENLVVILAGYTMEMQEFLTANSGLKSRFPNIIEFPDYTGKELLAISKSIAKSKGYTIREDCDAPLEVYYDVQQTTGDSRTNGNGRMARNKVEDAILNASQRAARAMNEVNLEELIPEDFEFKPAE